MLQVQLNPGLRGGKWAWLRHMRGHEEAFVEGTALVEAIAFLQRLLVEAPGTTVGPATVNELAVSDCDRLFAAIYMNHFGARVESMVQCRACEKPFELSFSLQDLMRSLKDNAASKTSGPDEEGIYTLGDGRRFRLPTIGDQHSVLGLDEEKAAAALLERCVVQGDPNQDPELLQAAMEEVGAFLDLDLVSSCPECDASQEVRFDIQRFVLRALAYERRFLLREIHRIAIAYGWKHEEILNLTRGDRRTFAGLIQSDREARRRAL
jgi:hypothetical protein